MPNDYWVRATARWIPACAGEADGRTMKDLFRSFFVTPTTILDAIAGAPCWRTLTVRGDSPPAPSPEFRRAPDHARSSGEDGRRGFPGCGSSLQRYNPILRRGEFRAR